MNARALREGDDHRGIAKKDRGSSALRCLGPPLLVSTSGRAIVSSTGSDLGIRCHCTRERGLEGPQGQRASLAGPARCSRQCLKPSATKPFAARATHSRSLHIRLTLPFVPIFVVGFGALGGLLFLSRLQTRGGMCDACATGGKGKGRGITGMQGTVR